jgi:predicted PurR-regulated permease PerM
LLKGSLGSGFPYRKAEVRDAYQIIPVLSRTERFSFVFITATFVAVAALHLGGPMIVLLFAYLALTKLNLLPHRGKWLAVFLFFLLLSFAIYWLVFFINQAVKALPEVANRAVPEIIGWAKHYQVELPFTDYDSLKDTIMDTIKGPVTYLAEFARAARGAAKQALFMIAGIVVAVSLFLNTRFQIRRASEAVPAPNLYTQCAEAIFRRFSVLFQSFTTVMGAQVVISAINTLLTAIFALSVQLPYPLVVVGVTFLCGMIPVIGNLVSNTIIVLIGFTVSPRMALFALIFLVVIHKLEYFLNSKIIGYRIRNPLWLTLLALVIGETLMGLPGLILAPVVLNYIRLEASAFKVESRTEMPSAAPEIARSKAAS